MYNRSDITEINEFFFEYSSRTKKGVFFCRINNYNNKVEEFILKYFEEAIKNGIVIEEKIQNPTEKNLQYYNEIMGMDFKLNLEFIFNSLKKWLPRIDDTQRKNVANSLFFVLNSLKKQNKTDNIIKNAYVKFMCWLYYRFERILIKLGKEKIPKILYEGYVSKYELLMLFILSLSGCDIIILQYLGDENYLAIDHNSEFSQKIFSELNEKFPNDFSIKTIRKKLNDKKNIEQIYEKSQVLINCTNAWIKGNVFKDAILPPIKRGEDQKFFYNCFFRVLGTEDKSSYSSNLFKLYTAIKNDNRNIIVIQKNIEIPSVDEISKISRGIYSSNNDMIYDLSKNIIYSYNNQIQNIAKKAFLDILLEFQNENKNITANKLINICVYILCWFNRFKDKLFKKWAYPQISTFIFFGNTNTQNEALFLKFLSRLPVDVIIFIPNIDSKSILNDKFLYDIKYEFSAEIEHFPIESSDITTGTAAYHAEKELNEILYNGGDMYKQNQYSSAVSLSLKTTFEEISILWNQNSQFRTGFDIIKDKVVIPVIFAKISGVKDKNLNEYYSYLKKLITDKTYVIKKVPFVNPMDFNPIKQYAAEFIKNGKLLIEKIKNHKAYQYKYLREEVQNYIFEKIQLLIDSKIISGTFESGIEYLIISSILNINKEIIRLIQNFDFTKSIPKIIFINNGEELYSKEDAIIAAFLNLIGFDILFVIPTGYRNIEQYYTKNIIEEFQTGEYMYDIKIPSLDSKHISFIDKIFRKGV